MFNDGGGDSDNFAGVAMDPMGDLVAVGAHEGTIDFSGAGGGLDSTIDGQGFVVQFNPQGTYSWSQGFTAAPDGLAVDGMGDVILCGEFSGMVGFGENMLTSTSKSIFVAKFEVTGSAVWSKAFAISGTNPSAKTLVSVDVAGNILLGVTANAGAIDFGGGLVSGGVLVAKLDPSGSFVWSKGFSEPAKATLQGIAAYDDMQILLGGTFEESLDFGSKTVSTTAGSSIFLAKLSLP